MKHFVDRRYVGIWILAATALIVLSVPRAESPIIDDSELPSVGEVADRTMTQAEEARIKRMLRAQLYGNLPISEDPESNAYMQDLVQRIRTAGEIEQEFDFLIVRDRQINAFAMPGGLLAFNTGLITQARNESELAGVVAHEMAHVTQRHLARMYDRMQNSNLSILTSAGILLAGLYDLSALLPATVLGQAAEMQRYLNHSRESEQEADRFATRFLARAGFDPNGVANFFEVLMQGRQPQYREDLEYLSTHPTSISRIVEARDRAQQYAGTFIQDRDLFHFIRERMISLLAPAHERLELYRNKLAAGHQPTPAEQYGAAVAWQKQGNHKRASEILANLETDVPDLHLLVTLARLRSLQHERDWSNLVQQLEQLHQEYPMHFAVEWYLAQAYLDAGRARDALKLARVRLRRGIEDPQTYRLIAEGRQRDGSTGYFAHCIGGLLHQPRTVLSGQPATYSG